jgi:hypothetical protein
VPTDSIPEIIILDVQELRLDRSTGHVVSVPALPEQGVEYREAMESIQEIVAPFPGDDPDKTHGS